MTSRTWIALFAMLVLVVGCYVVFEAVDEAAEVTAPEVEIDD